MILWVIVCGTRCHWGSMGQSFRVDLTKRNPVELKVCVGIVCSWGREVIALLIRMSCSHSVLRSILSKISSNVISARLRERSLVLCYWIRSILLANRVLDIRVSIFNWVIPATLWHHHLILIKLSSNRPLRERPVRRSLMYLFVIGGILTWAWVIV
jgi:hypothetical protein